MRRGGFLRRESAVVWVLGIGKAEGNGVRRHGAIECMNTDVLFFPPLFALEMVEWGMGLFLFSFLFFLFWLYTSSVRWVFFGSVDFSLASRRSSGRVRLLLCLTLLCSGFLLVR